MKKIILPITALMASVVAGHATKSISMEKTKKIRATITDLYARKNASVCQHLVAGCTFTSLLSNSVGGQQATIRSNGGTRYTLWEDNGCVSTPVYFQ